MGFQDAFMILGVGFALMLIPCWILRRAYKRAEALGLPLASPRRKKGAQKEEALEPANDDAHDRERKPTPAPAAE